MLWESIGSSGGTRARASTGSSQREICQAKRGYGPDVIGNNVDCHAGPDGAG
jgi:hypothetical protein